MTAIAPTRVRIRMDRRLGWRVARSDHLRVAETLTLATRRNTARSLTEPSGAFGGAHRPTGVTVDQHGVIYTLDGERGHVLAYEECCGSFTALACIGGVGSKPRQLSAPRGLLATPDGRLLVVDTGNRRIQVFAIETWALVDIWGPLDADGRAVRGRPGAGPVGEPGQPTFPDGTWEPWDVALDHRGCLLVSDRAGGRIHRLAADGTWLGTWSGTAPGFAALAAPTHLAVDHRGRVFVVDQVSVGGSTSDEVRAFDPDGSPIRPAQEDLPAAGPVDVIASDAAGNLYVIDGRPGASACYVCPAPAGTPVEVELPRGLGRVDALAFDASGSPLAVTSAGLVVLHPGEHHTSGTLVTSPLDSALPGCVWHGIELAGELPDNTSVEVGTFTTEVPDLLEDIPDATWLPAGCWSGPAEGRWDCLVDGTPGRYLAVRLVLRGSGVATPALSTVVATAPRATSARFLPAHWRSTERTGDFIERFVAIIDRINGSVEETLDELASYVDPAATPADSGRDFLRWLASWFDLANRLPVSEAVLRQLVANAAEIFGAKGTRRGIELVVRIILGVDPRVELPIPGIVEGFQLRRWAFVDSGRLGADTQLWGARIVDRLSVGRHSTIGSARLIDVPDPYRDPLHHHAHRATVFVPPVHDEVLERALREAIGLVTPAHVALVVEFVEARFLVGIQATLGMDAVLGAFPDGATLDGAALDGGSVLQRRGTATLARVADHGLGVAVL